MDFILLQSGLHGIKLLTQVLDHGIFFVENCLKSADAKELRLVFFENVRGYGACLWECGETGDEGGNVVDTGWAETDAAIGGVMDWVRHHQRGNRKIETL